jgi:hypothetical protein
VKAEVDHELRLQELKESIAKEKRDMQRMLLEDKPLGERAPAERPPMPKEGEHE